jgi:hypothetical protein
MLPSAVHLRLRHVPFAVPRTQTGKKKAGKKIQMKEIRRPARPPHLHAAQRI